jgi:hypothetical protein
LLDKNREFELSEQSNQKQVSSLTAMLQEVQGSHITEVQRRKDLVGQLSDSLVKLEERKYQHSIVSEHNERLQAELRELQHDYEVEGQRREALSRQLVSSPSRSGGERDHEHAILSKDYERAQSRLKEVQNDYNLEVQRRQALSRQLAEANEHNADDKVGRLQQDLLDKNREFELFEEKSQQKVSGLAAMLQELQGNYDAEVQRRKDMSLQVSLPPAKTDEPEREPSEFSEENERLQSELKELRRDYTAEVQRRQALSRQQGVVGAHASSDEHEAAHKIEQLELELLARTEALQESEQNSHQQVSSLTDRLQELQENYNIEVQRRQALSPQVSLSPANTDDRQGDHSIVSEENERLQSELRELQHESDERKHDQSIVSEENERLQAELRELQHNYNIEVQRRQDLRRHANSDEHDAGDIALSVQNNSDIVLIVIERKQLDTAKRAYVEALNASRQS